MADFGDAREVGLSLSGVADRDLLGGRLTEAPALVAPAKLLDEVDRPSG